MGKQRKGIKITPELIEEITKLVDERIRITYVKRDDFEGLKEIVRQLSENVLSLAEAQRRTQEEFVLFREMTEENFRKVWEAINQLTIRVDQLAEAQRRTEERLDAFERTTEENFKRVWESINQLAEAQRKTEERLSSLAQRVDELAEAQRKTEERLNSLTQRVDELAEAQRKTEESINSLAQRVDQLAEAQRKTEERLNQLIAEHQRTREILAGISDTVGYGLEDKVMLYMMKEFARDEYGIEAEVVGRKNIVYPDGRYDEVNIYIEGRRNGEKVYVIGECKSRPSKSEVDKLVKKRERLRSYLNADVYVFIVGYHFTPEVELYLQEEYPEVKVFRSYEFEMRYGRK